ncbi:hypothetical protein DINM_001215 [Dirofilaria immitis]|nr:hypothetical protein [Dirofilaria immitis]
MNLSHHGNDQLELRGEKAIKERRNNMCRQAPQFSISMAVYCPGNRKEASFCTNCICNEEGIALCPLTHLWSRILFGSMTMVTYELVNSVIHISLLFNMILSDPIQFDSIRSDPIQSNPI